MLGEIVRFMFPNVEGIKTSNHNDPTMSSWFQVKHEGLEPILRDKSTNGKPFKVKR
jgi:hypothetical protein